MRILILNQAFAPDVVSSGQHASDLARALMAAGHEVTVVASRRAYDSPGLRFPARESRNGVAVYRVLGTGFGKGARWRRAADFASLLCSYGFRLLRLGRFDVVIAMTSPPLISFLAALFVRLRGGRLVLWTLDLNPDEAIAAGWLRENSLAAGVLGWCLRFSLRTAQQVVTLDRFMKDRVETKLIDDRRSTASKVVVLPPWSHDSAVRYDEAGRTAFRRAHGLEEKFVLMYSGNHSPCHPLRTLIDAAGRLRDRTDIAFCFVGGGSEFESVKRHASEHGLTNVVCVPYQPLSALSGSLSAADAHVVVMGDAFVGLVHPCKVYNILRLGIPLLYIGPPASHVADLSPAERPAPWFADARHGDVEAVVEQVQRFAASRSTQHEAPRRIGERFGQRVLAAALVAIVEDAGRLRRADAATGLAGAGVTDSQ